MKNPLYPIAAGTLLLATAPAHAEGVGAGTLIENTAQAEYLTPDGPQTVESNTVTLLVNELLDVAVTSLQSGPATVSSSTATLPFEVSNTGNGPEAFRLTANPAVAGNDFEVTVDSIAIDRNGNGLFDPGVDEVLTGPATTPLLAADTFVTILVNVTLPTGLANGDNSLVELRADAVTGTGAPGTLFAGQGEDGVDAIVGSTTASDAATGELLVATISVGLVKSASVTDPFGGTSALPGAVITYTITATVSGSGMVQDLRVTDPYPTGTSYRPGTLRLDGAPLSDAADADAGAADLSRISVDLGDVAAGASHAITFQVDVD